MAYQRKIRDKLCPRHREKCQRKDAYAFGYNVLTDSHVLGCIPWEAYQGDGPQPHSLVYNSVEIWHVLEHIVINCRGIGELIVKLLLQLAKTGGGVEEHDDSVANRVGGCLGASNPGEHNKTAGFSKF